MAISKKLLNPGEQVIISTRQHPKALFVPILMLVLFLAVAVLAQVWLADDGFSRVLTYVVWVLAALGILWFSVRPFITWLTTVHAFTDRRLISRWGVLTRNGHDIPLNRVSDISIEINLIDRPFGCGSLIVTNAADGGKVRLNDIPHAEASHRRLSALMHEVHEVRNQRRDEGV
ncbi:PH domain-containing protein [Nocardioides sp. zg-536]|uniref:PH domain-containing protein n=1 Tax=Nocardioides faecalis TaxID=2803858 RepID=A0A939BVA3_9ACTN|nr:PH domain-containing protein [Nocardioides faecalis]MBM9459357.1 PH domain-containing protein [Nocardioides faecalis]MBS4751598.1 PH domain-containing protein [Nocardioides faecalis]QVI59528.1 PH domain-containing protein [Nocardioides faecalis]